MPKKRFSVEQIINHLREADLSVAIKEVHAGRSYLSPSIAPKD